jgi:hypothetical protein
MDDDPYNYYVRARKRPEAEGSSAPYNSYEERRQRLRRDYGHQPGVTLAVPNDEVPDFSSESIPADQVKPEQKPDFSAYGVPVDAVKVAPNASPAPRHPVAAPPPKPLVQPSSPAVTAEHRVALVIGNSAYRAVPVLPNPRRDAQAVAQALRDDGFKTVTLVNDAGLDALRNALRTFRAAADAADWGLIYYAGHGLQIGKTNYLVPADARLRDERDVDAEAVSYGELEKAVSGARALRLIILDACRTDPFEAQMVRVNPGRAFSRGLSPPPEPDAGMLIVYSAKDGQIAEDGDGANSPFAAALIAQLKVPGREVRRLFDFVRDDVMNATGRRQQPFTYGSLPAVRDYYFLARN